MHGNIHRNIGQKKDHRCCYPGVYKRGNYTLLARVCESLLRFALFSSGLSELVLLEADA
jgi:hypothetical protein